MIDGVLRQRRAWVGAICAGLALAACGGNDDNGNTGGTPVVPPGVPPITTPDSGYTIGGTVTGLAGGTLALRNNGSDDLAISANGAFQFARAVASGGTYDVRAVAQPAGQVCTLANAQGTATAAVASVAVTCVADASAVAPGVPATLSVSYQLRALQFNWSNTAGATYFRLSVDQTGGSNFTPVADLLGGTRYIQEEVSVLSYPAHTSPRYALQACNAAGCSNWSTSVVVDPARTVGYFKASNARAGYRFGHRVVMSRDGNTMAVVADTESSAATGIDGNQADTSAANAGAIYLFARSDDHWLQQAYIKASNTESGDFFGGDFALSSDGNTLAVGAIGEDSNATGIDGNQADNSAGTSGAVYVFTRNASNVWSQQAYVKASNTGANDTFGRAVSLSGDGNTLVVGAAGEASNATGIDNDQTDDSAPNTGAAYVFTRTGNTWTQQTYIKASNASAGARFGYALSLSEDGGTLAVGAYTDNTLGTLAGAAYVFARTGGTWTQEALVYGVNTEAQDRFGIAVALSGDGNTLVVGADSEGGNGSSMSDNSVPVSGAAYVFARAGAAWTQQAYLKSPAPDISDFFGSTLALSRDGNTLAVGAFAESGGSTGLDGDPTDNSVPSNGAAFLFTRTGTQWGTPRYIKPMVANASQQFSSGLSMRGDGKVLAIGSQGDSSNGAGIGASWDPAGVTSSGAVYLY